MGRKFLKAVLVRSTDKAMLKFGDTPAMACWVAAVKLLIEESPDAIDIQAEAWGGGNGR